MAINSFRLLENFIAHLLDRTNNDLLGKIKIFLLENLIGDVLNYPLVAIVISILENFRAHLLNYPLVGEL